MNEDDGWAERVAALLPEDYAIDDDPRRVIEAAIPRLLAELGAQFDRGVSAAEGAWGQPVSRAEAEEIRAESRAAYLADIRQYVPTTEQVRNAYRDAVGLHAGPHLAVAEFDRWFTSLAAEVR